MEIPVELSRILITEHGEQQMIFLKEIDGERSFPIVIGIAEALAIDRRLKGIPTPRPMTHDLVASILETLGAELEKIVICDLNEHTFYAKLHIQFQGRLIEIDSRPSDAIALGSGLNTPIFVSDHIFDLISGGEPSTREERLELLRNRLDVLNEQISSLSNMLQDQNFLESTPQTIIDQYKKQLSDMQKESTAIEDVLDRFE